MKYALIIDGQKHVLEWAQGEIFSCALDGVPFQAEVAEIAPGLFSLLIGGKSFSARISTGSERTDGGAKGESNYYSVQVDGTTYAVTLLDPRRWTHGRGTMARAGRQQITAPMAGKVIRMLVSEGQRVESGRGLLVVEAMKMQNEIKSHAAGAVKKVLVAEGQPVTAGETLLIIE